MRRLMNRKATVIAGMFLSLGLLSAGYASTKLEGMKAVNTPPRSGGLAAVASQDRTGSPISSGLCSACHAGGSFGTTFQITVRDLGNNIVTSYIPGAQYTVEYIVAGTTGTPSGFGMQSAILDASNSNAGSFGSVSTTSTQVSTIGGIQFVEQQGASSSGLFIVDWTAPSSGTGSVTVYGNGIAINGNGGTSGDAGSPAVNLSLTEDVPTAINFPGNPYCSDATNPTPSVVGEQGGTFSAPLGLDINTASGLVNIAGSTPGTYTVTYSGATETATFDVTINETYNTTDAVSICPNESYQFGSQTLTASNVGLNTQVFQASNGCDSTVDLTLSVLPSPVTQLSQSICSNETIQFNGQTLDASNAGLNTFTTSGSNGCDSTLELTLNVLSLDTVQVSETICQGATFDFNGQILDESNVGLNTATLSNVNGCDSIVELTLSVTQIDTTITPNLFSLISNETSANASFVWLDCEDNLAIVPNENTETLNVVDFGSWAAVITLDGCVDTTECEMPFYMGIDENNTSAIQVYPSPAENTLYVKNLSDLTEVDFLQIVNLSGQQVWSNTSLTDEINVSALPPGTYFLKVRHAKGEDIVRFIKR